VNLQEELIKKKRKLVQIWNECGNIKMSNQELDQTSFRI
jgi:hypothetical protein